MPDSVSVVSVKLVVVVTLIYSSVKDVCSFYTGYTEIQSSLVKFLDDTLPKAHEVFNSVRF